MRLIKETSERSSSQNWALEELLYSGAIFCEFEGYCIKGGAISALLELCDRIIQTHSNPGDTVYIPFAGSGSEIISCIKNSRHSIATEIDAKYIELINNRLQKFCGTNEGGTTIQNNLELQYAHINSRDYLAISISP